MSLVWLGTACDGGQASLRSESPADARLRQESLEIVVRLDAPQDADPAASVLAFHARYRPLEGIDPMPVLGAVDPLAISPPEANCALRRVDETTNRLEALGGNIELEAEHRISVPFENTTLRPIPRVFPDLGRVVSGVVAEAGPQDLSSLPETITVTEKGVPVFQTPRPSVPELVIDGLAPTSATSEFVAEAVDVNAVSALLRDPVRLSRTAPLAMTVTGEDNTFVELRPFGATHWVSCRPDEAGRVEIPSSLIRRLLDELGQGAVEVPVALDAVTRSRQAVYIGQDTAFVTIEVRRSTQVAFAR